MLVMSADEAMSNDDAFRKAEEILMEDLLVIPQFQNRLKGEDFIPPSVRTGEEAHAVRQLRITVDSKNPDEVARVEAHVKRVLESEG